MNKKQLFQTNEKLFSLLDTNKKEIEILNKKLNELNTLLKAKDFEIEELKKQDEIKKELTGNSENSFKPNDITNENTLADINENFQANTAENSIADLTDLANFKENVKDEPEEPEEPEDETEKSEENINLNNIPANNNTFKKIKELSENAIPLENCNPLPEKYVAETISKVSYKAALIYNELKTDKNISKDYANELLTLTLGKLELFKASSYELLNKNLSYEDLSKSLQNLENETVSFLSDIHLKISNL